MGGEDIIGAYRKARPPLPTESVQRSATRIHDINANKGLAHVYQTPNRFEPVLNSTVTSLKKTTSANHHLFLFNGSIWVQHQGSVQRDFVENYFDKTFSQFNLNDKGNALCPHVYSLTDFNTSYGKEVLLAQIKELKITTVSIFDLTYDSTSNINLINYEIAPGYTLEHLTKDVVGDNDEHLIVGMFSKKYDGGNMELIRHHVNEFWSREPRANFIFPTSPYSLDSLFSFEFGTLAEVLKNLSNNYLQCSDVLADAQVEIASRYREIQNHPNNEDPSICASSFVYFSRAMLDYQSSATEISSHSDSSKVTVHPFLPALGTHAMESPAGFKKAACSEVEDIIMRLCYKSINFLNELALNENFECQEILFGISLSIFDYLSERANPLPDAQVLSLYKLYLDEGKVPFPEHLFRYASRPPTRAKVALSKLFQSFHITTKWEIGPQKATERTLHYIAILKGTASVRYKEVMRELNTLIKSVRKVGYDSKLQSCFGFELNAGRAFYPHGILMLDNEFTKILNKLVHRFHVVHNQELEHLKVNNHYPRADLWVGSDATYFMTANQVNEALIDLANYFRRIRHPAPFGDCDQYIRLDYTEEPSWLMQNWKWNEEEEE